MINQIFRVMRSNIKIIARSSGGKNWKSSLYQNA